MTRRDMARFLKALFTICPVLVIITGCQTIHAPSSPYEIWKPPTWEKSSKNTDPVWLNVRHRMLTTAEPLSLGSLAEVAIMNNPSTRQAWETARAFESQKRVTEGTMLPTLTGNFEVFPTRTVDSNKVNNANQLTYGPSASVSYLLLDLGGRKARIKGAYFDLLNSNQSYNQAVQDLLLNVGKAYYTLHSAQATVDAREADLQNSHLVLTAAQKKLDAGLVSKLDLYQAQTNYYTDVYALQSAEGDVKSKKGDLANVLGLSADTKFTIKVPSRQIPTGLTRRDVSKLIEFALKTRPDILAGRASLSSKLEAVKAAESDVFPTVTAGASLNKENFYFYNSPKSWGDDFSYSTFDLKLSWDVFDGYQKVNLKEKAGRLAAAERDKLEQTELAASNDVWTKYFAFKTAIKKLNSSKALVRSSQGSYDLALEGYQAGLKSMLDLTNAQSDLSNARSQLIQSERDLFIALIDLVHSLGVLYPGLEMAGLHT